MRALVLTGGSCRAAWSCGVLKHLLGDLKINFDILVGTSSGALNCSIISHYKTGQEQEAVNHLIKLWKSIDNNKIYKRWFFGRISGLWKPSIYDSSPLIELVRSTIKPELIRSSGKKFRVGAVSIDSGKYCVFDENFYDLPGAILASCSYPTLFLPINLKTPAGNYEWFTDGGIKNMTAISEAIKTGADEIEVIMTTPPGLKHESRKKHNILNLGSRIIEIAHEQIIEKDLLQTIKINNIIKNGGHIPGKRFINIKVIRPAEDLNVSSFDFSQKNICNLIQLGYETAINSYAESLI